MPFITTPFENHSEPLFYVIRGAQSRIGASLVAQKIATKWHHQGKKVLLFDTLLGLKSINRSYKNASHIDAVLNGQLPLTNLIKTNDGIDFITGTADINLNALSVFAQNKIKADLKKIALSYDLTIIDDSYHAPKSLFHDMGENIWVVPPNKATILKTLRQMDTTSSLHLLIQTKASDATLNQLFLFIKTLSPACKISILET